MSVCARRLLVGVWLCFLAKGFFYASLFPLWEGFDEWSHYAFIRHLAVEKSLPLADSSRISLDIAASLELAPVPWALKNYPPPSITHDDYWRLPAGERARREVAMRSIPPESALEQAPSGRPIYEAQQPPLYYWLMAWPLRATLPWPLASRVMLLRWIAVLFSSLAVPLGFFAARTVFGRDDRAIGVAALMAAMPELMVNVSRVSNECLALPLFTFLVYLALKSAESPENTKYALGLGAALGLGLLTKVYFLTAIPALLTLLVYLLWRETALRARIVWNAAAAIGVTVAVSSWWFLLNRRTTGTWTRLTEDVAVRGLSFWNRARQVPNVDWRKAIDTIFFSHIWIGGWSFLELRAWIYRFFAAIVVASVAGLLAPIARSRLAAGRRESQAQAPFLLVLISLYGSLLLGEMYHVLLIFLADGVSLSNGWYLCCQAATEAMLVALGLMALLPVRFHPWVLPSVAACFAILELYATNFVMIPYYSGMIAHRAGGSLSAFHLSQFGGGGMGTMIERLLVNKPLTLGPFSFAALWILFPTVTFFLVWIAVNSARGMEE